MKLGWFSQLSRTERNTYYACFGGLALDSMDTTIYSLVVPTLIAVLGITKPEAGLLGSANLVGSALGGWLAGIAADRLGRVRVMQIAILLVALSSFGAAFADNFTHLLIARAIQGIGYGGEAAVGAVLISEVIAPRLRGRVASSIQSGYAIGNSISVAAMPLIFAWLPPELAWRAFFAIGFLPAIFIVFIQKLVPESSIFMDEAKKLQAAGKRAAFYEIFTGPHLKKTIIATAFSTGTLGAAYVMIIWLPTYVRTVLGLPVTQTAGYLIVNILGSFCGPLAYGYLADRIGRRRSFMLFLVCQAINVCIYTQLPIGMAMAIGQGFFLGAFQGGLASGMLPTFSELFPTRIRGNGAGFSLSSGRGIGSVVPTTVGILSATLPLGDAMAACAVCGYGLAFLAALALPETAGADLTAPAGGPATPAAPSLDPAGTSHDR